MSRSLLTSDVANILPFEFQASLDGVGVHSNTVQAGSRGTLPVGSALSGACCHLRSRGALRDQADQNPNILTTSLDRGFGKVFSGMYA